MNSTHVTSVVRRWHRSTSSISPRADGRGIVKLHVELQLYSFLGLDPPEHRHVTREEEEARVAEVVALQRHGDGIVDAFLLEELWRAVPPAGSTRDKNAGLQRRAVERVGVGVCSRECRSSEARRVQGCGCLSPSGAWVKGWGLCPV